MAAKTALSNLMKGRPDTNAENPKYLAEMVESLAHLTDQELAWLTSPRDGLHTVCKFLPTPADVHQFLREKREKLEQFKPAATSWRKIEDNPEAPWNRETDAERKRRLVLEVLGYDPDNRGHQQKPALTEPSDADVKNLKLTTPTKPISKELRENLQAQGWTFIPGVESAA